MVDDERSPRRLLEQRGLRPRKRFGQNFLVDPRFARAVASSVPEGSFVIEIGGGTGTLTRAIAERARKTIAIEIDRDLAVLLRDTFAGEAVEIVEGDALSYDFGGAFAAQVPPRAICANLPYYLTTPLIEKAVEAADHWEAASLMVQREYAKRLLGRPGSADYGSLTVFVGYYCRVSKLFDVGAAGFYPAPNVASTVVGLVPRRDRRDGVRDEPLLLRTIRAAFSQRRKTLTNAIASRATYAGRDALESAIRAAGIDPKVRGERLSLDDFVRLSNAFSIEDIAIG